MPPVDPYQVLQVLPTAEQEVVSAAFRALALKYHPDRDSTSRAAQRMRQLNEAWALVRDDGARARYDRSRRTLSTAAQAAVTPGTPPVPMYTSEGPTVDFGRYAGWSIRDLARQDPDYLRWLARHSAGVRFRTEIYRILGTTAA
ncbi:MAG: DnaJ domain-containing protein [Chloroflexota bacterium]|nr:DnaJ domain-containing protein [Chloroflexota bacterium]